MGEGLETSGGMSERERRRWYSSVRSFEEGWGGGGRGGGMTNMCCSGVFP